MSNLDRYGRRLLGSAVYQGYPIARYFKRIDKLLAFMDELRLKNPSLVFKINPGGESFSVVNTPSVTGI